MNDSERQGEMEKKKREFIKKNGIDNAKAILPFFR